MPDDLINDETERRAGPFQVEIRRNRDGLVRLVGGWGDGWSRFWYEDGNGGCDCNRGQMFAESAGEDESHESCGSSAYTILRYLFPDGSEQPGDPPA